MNIGIIIHSQSGHTYTAAAKLQEKLASAGHKATIERLQPIGDAHPGVTNLRLESYPETGAYDGLVFAAPVWAFSISPVILTYLTQLPSLKGKKIACFTMMGFPFTWMGGNHAIQQLKQACASKGGTVLSTAVIGRSGNDEKSVTKMLVALSEVF